MAPSAQHRRHRTHTSQRLTLATLSAVALGLGMAYLVTRSSSQAPRAVQYKQSAEQRDAQSGLGVHKHKRIGAAAATNAATSLVTAADTEEQRWFEQLSDMACHETETLRICSHRAATDEIEDVPSGSLTAYSALFRQHIR